MEVRWWLELGHGRGTRDHSSYHPLDLPLLQTLCSSQQDLGSVLIHNLLVNGSQQEIQESTTSI